MSINWHNPPYDHKNWTKDQVSIMNPMAKVTWPQFIAEMVIWNRTRIMNEYKVIKRGPGWSGQIADKVRKLIQQAYAICNYFPHPKDETIVYVAFKNYFRNHKVLKIGQLRKVRVKNDKVLITQDEKDIVKGVTMELERLLEQRNAFIKTSPKTEEVRSNEEASFRTNALTEVKRPKTLAEIMALESKLKRSTES